jgi:protein downstream neighbor of Son
MESLRSLYFAYRHGHCPFFYVCTTDFTAVFLPAPGGGDNAVRAAVSRSTRGLRQMLDEEGTAGAPLPSLSLSLANPPTG